MYAAGKIPGGFFKREGRPTERAILTARMIDRPIRPLWPKGFRNEVQVICTIALGRPRHPARHPLHQRRVGGADDLAAAVLRPGRRGADGDDRRQARRQPDARRRSRSETLARPDRRRHEGRADDGRGRRRRDPRGRAARGARARARGDQAALRGAGGARPAGRQAEVARRVADRGAQGLARRPDPRARSPSTASARRSAAVEEIFARALSRADDGVDRGGHHPPGAGSPEPEHAARDAPARGGRRPGPRSSSRPSCGR